MKTLNIKTAQIEEIIIRPLENIPLSISYKLFSDTGELITVRRISINKADLPTAGQDAIDTLMQKLSEKITTKEL